LAAEEIAKDEASLKQFELIEEQVNKNNDIVDAAEYQTSFTNDIF